MFNPKQGLVEDLVIYGTSEGVTLFERFLLLCDTSFTFDQHEKEVPAREVLFLIDTSIALSDLLL